MSFWAFWAIAVKLGLGPKAASWALLRGVKITPRAAIRAAVPESMVANWAGLADTVGTLVTVWPRAKVTMMITPNAAARPVITGLRRGRLMASE
jgi:hypothetical protein